MTYCQRTFHRIYDWLDATDSGLTDEQRIQQARDQYRRDSNPARRKAIQAAAERWCQTHGKQQLLKPKNKQAFWLQYGIGLPAD